jgi:hypothetical protein
MQTTALHCEDKLSFPCCPGAQGSCSVLSYTTTGTPIDIPRLAVFLSRSIVFQELFNDLKPQHVALLIRARDIRWYHVEDPAVT